MNADDYQKDALRTEFTPECININTTKALHALEARGKPTQCAGCQSCEFRGDHPIVPAFGDNDLIAEAVEKDQQLARLLHGALGACTETGELQDMIKKHLIYGKPLDLVNVIEEIGDTMWYLAIVLDACGVTMSDAMQRNITKLRLRYPEKFTSEKALNRDLAAERAALESPAFDIDEHLGDPRMPRDLDR